MSKKSKVFSTGPLENANNVSTHSTEVVIKVLNNDKDDETKVHIKVFSLNGKKVLIGEAKFKVPPESSDFRIFDSVNDTTQFEVQIELKDETDDVLLSVWGKTGTFDLIAAHRVLHSELTKIDELTD